LGLYLAKKTVIKADVFWHRDISKSLLTELTSNDFPKLSTNELYMIALAIIAYPREIFKELGLMEMEQNQELTINFKIEKSKNILKGI